MTEASEKQPPCEWCAEMGLELRAAKDAAKELTAHFHTRCPVCQPQGTPQLRQVERDRDELVDMLQEGLGLLAGHDLYCAQEEQHDDVCAWMDRARTLLHGAEKDRVK